MSHKPRKRFGQNFLHDEAMISKIIAGIAPNPNQYIVEIGPGLGALTSPILSSGASLDVVELDRDLIPKLQKKFAANTNLTIHQADALEFNFAEISNNKKSKIRVIGNLPYNISTPLLFHLLSQRECIIDMHFMLQKEVVDRITASPGNKDYGRLSIMIQYYCSTVKLLDVGPDCFDPPPKVQSAIVRLTPFEELPHISSNEAMLAMLVKQAFSQRRKTIHNSLKTLVAPDQFEQAGVDPTLRPERLTVADFVKLSNTIK